MRTIYFRRALSLRRFFVSSSRFLLTLVFAAIVMSIPTQAQTKVVTWHYDNARTSANLTETILTPANVNPTTFGKLFTDPVDGYIVGHPLYLPGITIGGAIHNVVYVATQHDSVYAFDADHAGPPLWQTSFLLNGATTVPIAVQKCGGVTAWTEVGIVSTPVIDATAGTLFLVAKTVESGAFVHRLHAVDVLTGLEKPGSPVKIAATFSSGGNTYTFADKMQVNRPGLLLSNGNVYIAFGSDGCNNGPEQGWVIAYSASTLQLVGAFDDMPGGNFSAIWQQGAGISADVLGNVYAESGEGQINPGGGIQLGQTIIKLASNASLVDWFTPFNWSSILANDQDLNNAVLILPDQSGSHPHEAIAFGKAGVVYLLDRDNLGKLCSTCTTTNTQIVQELPSFGPEPGSAAYWNGRVYFTPQHSPLVAYSLNNGLLSTTPVAQSNKVIGGGSALITANGNTNAILWEMEPGLTAYDALSLKQIYKANQAPNGRDLLPPLPHFATTVVADGKAFVGTTNSLAVYGLLSTAGFISALNVTAGNNQSGAVNSLLPVPLSIQAIAPTGSPASGVPVAFSSPQGGTFGNANPTTDANGNASTTYTLPATSGVSTITAASAGFASATFTETAGTGSDTIARHGGSGQIGAVSTQLPQPLCVIVTDASHIGVAGVNVTYTNPALGGTLSPNPALTNVNGVACTTYTLPPTPQKITIKAQAPGIATTIFFYETAQ